MVARMLESQAAQKLTHELKPQLAALLRPTRGCGGAALRPVALSGRLVDVCIAAWLAMPDCATVSDNPNTASFRARSRHQNACKTQVCIGRFRKGTCIFLTGGLGT